MRYLGGLYARLCEESDPVRLAVRDANRAGYEAKQLENSTLESGAMPNEFSVVLQFRSTHGFPRLTPVLR
jgi:hypothetical protein